MVAAVRLRGLETDLELLQKPDQMHLLIRRQWEVPREVRTRHPPRANNVETDLLDSSRLRWAWKEME